MALETFESVIEKINLLERKVLTRIIRELEIRRRYREQYKPNQEFTKLVIKYYDVVIKRPRLIRRNNQILSYMSFS